MEGVIVKRKRSNFSPDEKIQLLCEIKKFQHIVENKKTDAVSWQEKQEAWKKITNNFNSRSTVFRTVDCIKSFYENQKRSVHKKVAADRRAINATGGGRFVKTEDPAFDLTLSIVNPRTIYGLENLYDGDARPVAQVNEDITPIIMNPLGNYNETIELIVDPEDVPSYTEEIPVKKSYFKNPLDPRLVAISKSATCINDEQDSSHRASLVSPKEPATCNKESIPFTPRTKAVKPKETASGSAGNEDWLSRRRPALAATTTLARKYEELADYKLEVARMQLATLKEGRERDQELHIYKVQQEQLEVKIKEAQLQLLLKSIKGN